MRNGPLKPVNRRSIHAPCQSISGVSIITHDSCFVRVRVFAETGDADSPGGSSIVIRGRNLAAMPTDAIQGLYFLLGLLMAFYLLAPFLELAVR